MTTQISFATLTQIKPLHFSFILETLLSSQKADCHPILGEFEKDQLSIQSTDIDRKVIFRQRS